MYEDPVRAPSGDWDPGLLSRHVYSNRQWLRGFQNVRGRIEAGSLPVSVVMPFVQSYLSNPLVYFAAWSRLERTGGTAPGPDGLRYSDVEPRDRFAFCRLAAKFIKNGQYAPGPERLVSIPKANGNGRRALSLMGVVDRVVHRGVAAVVGPLFEAGFSRRSFGFRPGRDRRHAAATLSRFWNEGRRILLLVDLRNAFDHVPHARLLDVVRQRLAGSPATEVVRACLKRRGSRAGSMKGLRQGSSLSPLLLNAYLDHFLDRPWLARKPSVPLLRYADDVCVCCASAEEAGAALVDLQEILRPTGMKLNDANPETVIFDLAGGAVGDYLGFRLQGDGDALRVRIGDAAYRSLNDRLEKAHERPYPSITADQIIRGWLAQQGPCFGDSDRPEVYRKFARICRGCGFEEIPSGAEFEQQWSEAHDRWRAILEAEESATD